LIWTATGAFPPRKHPRIEFLAELEMAELLAATGFLGARDTLERT
jgi:hypothetical protein